MTIDIASPGADEAALEAALVQRLPPARLPMVSGRSYRGLNMVLTSGIPDFGYGYVFGSPILIPNAITIASLSINVVTSADATTQTARVGIAVDNNGVPSQTLLAEGTAALDLTGLGGLRTAVMTDAAVAAGWHWLMIFITPPIGGAAIGADLVCFDPLKVLESAFHTGFATVAHPLSTDLGADPPALFSESYDTETNFPTLQAALTALGPVNGLSGGVCFFPAIAITVA